MKKSERYLLVMIALCMFELFSGHYYQMIFGMLLIIVIQLEAIWDRIR